MLGFLGGTDAAVLSHSQLEDRLDVEGRQLLHQLFQDHLELRGVRESRVEVADADGVRRGRVETGHTRGLATLFRRGGGDTAGLPQRRPTEPASGRRDAQPAHRETLPRAGAAGRGRKRTRLVRRCGRGDRPDDGTTGRQTPGGRPRTAQRDRLRRLLRPPEGPHRRPRRRARVVLRRQGHRHAPRRAAEIDRPGSREDQPEASDPTVQRRETQPQADGRGRHRLRRHPRPAHTR